jgi:hypothetical protein
MYCLARINQVQKWYMSRSLLRLLLGDIGFVYPVMSMMVIGPSLPILRQRWWSLMYDVY